MFRHTIQLLLVTCLASGTVSAANEPFVGEWKLDPSKSKLTDQMKVESVAGNKYAFDFGGDSAETIAPDGTDQPGLASTTLSITIEAPDSWKVVRKHEGRILLTAYWKLSKDGNTLTDDFTQFGPNGSTTNMKTVYNRVAGTSGFAGTWESTSEALNSSYVIKVQPYEGDGLSFIYSSQGVTKNLKFDGKDYPQVGANALPGSTTAARRVNAHTLEMTSKLNDKVASTQEIRLSSDRKTLTMIVHAAGRTRPSILVFCTVVLKSSKAAEACSRCPSFLRTRTGFNLDGNRTVIRGPNVFRRVGDAIPANDVPRAADMHRCHTIRQGRRAHVGIIQQVNDTGRVRVLCFLLKSVGRHLHNLLSTPRSGRSVLYDTGSVACHSLFTSLVTERAGGYCPPVEVVGNAAA